MRLSAFLPLVMLTLASIVMVPRVNASPPSPGDEEALRAQNVPSAELDSLLARMERVASLYTDEALRFTCEEDIAFSTRREDGWLTRRRGIELNYIYVFNEPSAAGGEDHPVGLVDYRTERVREGEEDEAREVRLEDLNLPIHLKRAYSWVFIFREALRSGYRFEIHGEAKMLGRDAIVLGFEAVPPCREGLNDWVGRAWIDGETYQLLQVEAMSCDDFEEQAGLAEAREEAEISRPHYEFVKITTEFAEQMHGMRFPSKVSLVGSWAGCCVPMLDRYQELTSFQVDQAYSDYSFFSVRTESEILAYVLAGVEIKD